MNMFRIETIYVYYIVMEIYVLDCMNIFSPFYSPCTTSMPHHFPTMIFTWTTPKPFKTKSPLLSQFYSIKLHVHTTTFLYPKWRSFQRSQTPTHILTKRKLNKKFPKVYTSHGPPCDFTRIIKCNDFRMTFTY
jgi:hypothetical protein